MASFRNKQQADQREAGTLAPRLEVPVRGGWQRLYAGPKRLQMLEQAFSSEAMLRGGVFALVGESGTQKSMTALAVCDLRDYRAVYATDQTDRPVFEVTSRLCVIVDPVSAYRREDVASCVKTYRGRCPIILIDRHESALGGIIQPNDTVVRLKLPSAESIAAYIKALLGGYQSQLSEADYVALGQAMRGLNLAQVNQITVDATLSRLQYKQPVDRRAFDEALHAFHAVRSAG